MKVLRLVLSKYVGCDLNRYILQIRRVLMNPPVSFFYDKTTYLSALISPISRLKPFMNTLASRL